MISIGHAVNAWNDYDQTGVRIGKWWVVWYRTEWRPLFDPPGKAHRLVIRRAPWGRLVDYRSES